MSHLNLNTKENKNHFKPIYFVVNQTEYVFPTDSTVSSSSFPKQDYYQNGNIKGTQFTQTIMAYSVHYMTKKNLKNLKHNIEVECQKFFSISISAWTATTPLLILRNRLRNPLKISAIQIEIMLSEVRKAVICTQLNLKLKKVT
jgi:hypothetical protein